jgi:hypothetical protein
MLSQPPGYGTASDEAQASTMLNLLSMVRRSHMLCTGCPARRTPVFRW